MSTPESQENPWSLEATRPVRLRAVEGRLAVYGITDPRHVARILAALDLHGLFHEVITPKLGDTGKDIKRRAKQTAKTLWRRITNIRKGKEPPADSQEADLAERWEQLGADQMRLEELKVLSETFQINRGGRIIPRYARQQNRNVSPQGPRSKPEITHALQILDRYLREECSMRTNRRMECLGDILRSAMNLPDSREEVIEQVRWRLRDVKNKTPLHNVDYYEAIGITDQTDDDRQKMFAGCMSILHSPLTSAMKKLSTENKLEELFSFK